jgi:hypothetical protein
MGCLTTSSRIPYCSFASARWGRCSPGRHTQVRLWLRSPAGPVRRAAQPAHGRPGRPVLRSRPAGGRGCRLRYAPSILCGVWPRRSPRGPHFRAWTAAFCCRCRSPWAGPCAPPTRARWIAHRPLGPRIHRVQPAPKLLMYRVPRRQIIRYQTP